MNKKVIVTILIIIIISLSIGGCWSRKEPKELAVITSVVYDMQDDGNYRLIIEYLKPQQVQDGNGNRGFLLQTFYGKTIPETIRSSSSSIDRILHGGNNKVRFFTEEFAEYGLHDIMDYLLRSQLTDERPLVMIIKADNPYELYEAEMGFSEILGIHIESLSRIENEVLSYAVFPKTLDFVKDLYSKGKQPVAGVIEIIPNEIGEHSEETEEKDAPKKTRLKCEGLAVFKDDKFIGYMDGYDAFVYNLINNDLKKSVQSVNIGEDLIVGNLYRYKTKIKTSLIDDIVNIDLNLKCEMSIVQNVGSIDSSEIKDSKVIADAYNELYKSQITETILKAQEYQSDIFGFGNYFHKDNAKEWKRIQDKWDDDYFSSAVINVTVESIVKAEGEISHPFGWRIKK